MRKEKQIKKLFSVFLEVDQMKYIEEQSERFNLTKADIIRRAIELHRLTSAKVGNGNTFAL